ncbi:MAG: class I SAM-dependent methyltransferase [Candidatus Woesearchaeota archaeon]
MKFLLKNNEPKLERYIKKLSKGKNIPLITKRNYNHKDNNDFNIIEYIVDFSNTNIKLNNNITSLVSLESHDPNIKDNKIIYYLNERKLDEFHTKILKKLPEVFSILKGKFSDENWQYWQMIQNYGEFRKNFKYYREAFNFASKMSVTKHGKILDVGIKDSTVTLDMFPNTYQKFAIDNEFPNDFVYPKDINCIEMDIFDYKPEGKYDIVLCQQVLEHVDDPKKFYSKLKSLSKDIIVISVPYGSWHNTPFDPINEKRVKQWTGEKPVLESIVEDFGVKRYIAGYKVRDTIR